MNQIGWSYVHLDDPQAAFDHCDRALALQQEIRDTSGAANTLDTMGRAFHGLGDHRQAIASYRRALELYDHSEARLGRAETLERLGDSYRAIDDVGASRNAWVAAVEILDQLGLAEADRLRAKLDALAPARRV